MDGEFYAGRVLSSSAAPRSPYEVWTEVSDRRATTRVRRMVLGAIVLLLVQTGIGMDVNLYVAVPTHHPGAQAANYFTGSVHSVAWVIAHGAPALAIHASLGLALIVLAIAIPVRTLKIAPRSAGGWTTLAAALIIGAGFNGASFLDFANDSNSLIMALLALGAIAGYAIALFLVPATP
jgi:hypothetical protein